IGYSCPMRRFIVYIILAFTAIATFGQIPADSVNIYFRLGQRWYDASIGDNRANMDALIARLNNINVDDIERLEVRGYASPDGSEKANDRLSGLRCNEIAQYISQHTDINRDIIYAIPGGVAWNELRRLVAETPEVPMRNEVLNMLDNTPVATYGPAGNTISGRKRELMRLGGGEPYRWMYENLFPQLRNAVAVTLYLKSDVAKASEVPSLSDTIKTDSVKPYESAEFIDSKASTEMMDTVIAVAEEQSVIEDQPKRQRFALKNNFLYDAALMPNLEFEWLINDNWSVAVEGEVAWWSRAAKNKYYELAIISGEGRYWINPKAPWHGMYVGVFAGGGWYQLANGGNKGYQGEGGMAGVSLGYMFPISKYLSLEAGIGAGYMRTQYKEYEPRDGHLLYMRTKNLNYFGPLKAKFSIVWRFNNINYTKKAK
ncbi:MAG: DUF3575 domain-containing protein, partial [Muribaculaceae bacterium]|nr:DUF3575 domain-containing protein [Muribaculaceae bacterium]